VSDIDEQSETPEDEARRDAAVAAAEATVEAVVGDEPERTETEERYARPEADRLSEEMLAEVRTRTTGAKAAAFFDLDKTVIARSSTLVMGRTFMRDGLISPSMVLRGLYAQVVYQLVGADHEKMEQMRHALLELTTGWDKARVEALVRETMEAVIAPLVYQEALDLFTEHRAAGRDIWIVSSSGEEIVVPFAEHLGVRDVIATRSGLDRDGRYDGTLEFYAYSGNKANAVRQIAQARGYDLDDCYAYSDSITDLPMLSAVGHATAVNPDRELRAAAVAMDWLVRDFHSPVTLRSRLPDIQRPSNSSLGVAVGVTVAALLIWRFVLRDDEA
jgi:HAD superfamily hydrolase (TIGR01490 family)